MPIKIGISPKIILSIATLYNDVNRIFMEYIDNSLDSAEDLYSVEENSYKRPVEIALIIQGRDFRGGQVQIIDNCIGITNFSKVVQSIGFSDKKVKAQPWINGQFGYGIYSFLACCEKLEITSKLQKEDALYIPINRDQFEAERQEDVVFPDPKKVRKFDFESGTKVCLSNFDKTCWRQVDIVELKSEIEKHFELLLARKNLSIKLIKKDDSIFNQDEEIICKSFDYGQYDGEVWEDYAETLSFSWGKKNPVRTTIKPRKPIHVYIKITTGKEINKRPVFISKGRRIGEIKDIKSFKSSHKSDLWDHPNVTGYVDLSDFLDPTIARNDFRNNNNSKALYNYLIEIEPLILDEIKNVNKKAEERHYQELEDKLNEALSKLARIDSMMYRTDYISGDKVNLEKNGIGKHIDEESGGKDHGKDRDGSRSGKGVGDSLGDGKGIDNGFGGLPGGDKGGDNALNKEASNPFEDTGFKGQEKRKSGFNIRIVDREPDIDNETKKPIRSSLIGNEITIFKQHTDFQDRVDVSRKREAKITQRLITYLAGEITVHYKDKFHNKNGQPEYNKKLFIDLVSFVYEFEKMLKDLSGKNLADLNS